MFFRQLYDTGLAQASYVIGCQETGEAIVIDPLRDPAPYMAVAESEGLRITHITETHIHADFLSGARELRAATGAQLFLSAEGGTDWQYQYATTDGATLLRDGDRIVVGNLHFDVMHTPGHTPEHLSFVVTDTPRAAGPMGVLTGDFVFVGDVGRPDLLERAAKIANTMEAGARTLFRSLEKFRALPDHLQVWPGHGAGSACGKALGAVPSSTVGYEKKANWGVGTTDEALFVQMVLEGQPEPPRYFAAMKRLNRDGPAILGARLTAPLERMSEEAILALDGRSWIVDTRPAAAFAARQVRGSLSVPLGRSFSTHVGSLVPIDVPIVLIAREAAGESPESVLDARVRLAQIGFDNIIGYAPADALLAAAALQDRIGSTSQISVDELARDGSGNAAGAAVIDVRGLSEWQAGHLPQAKHLPLGELPTRLEAIPDDVIVQCQSGGRSSVAASLLNRDAFFAGRGVTVRNLVGGYVAWRSAGLPVSRDP